MWMFSDLQGQNRVLQYTSPELKGLQPDPTPEEIAREPWLSRRPFIYQPAENTVYIGEPGMHHANVRHQYGLGINDNNQFEGSIMKGVPDHWNWLANNTATWYSKAPEHHQEILNEIAKAHQVVPEHFNADIFKFSNNEFKFSSCA